MKYLDSNVFLYPILYEGKKTDNAQAILMEMVEGDIHCITASLTLDEVIWIVSKKISRKKALEIGKDILELPNLKILDVTAKDILVSIDLMERYAHLKPRDAIHSAVCMNAGVFTMVSDDNDFDGIEEINREALG
ncbi:MAG: type II toxin-antitoxin system VapC family toxin [Candidatus Thermoplasmatota archaeon]|jgi:predicted nucleic acid-binding protein|nr:type II toxin-antitoxin system VapC family toxin [Candidatus Thermoplasmatota archaeon]MDP7264573.1 type II toxin-antitoxin system VapC family toxin [Candidatus Thermoplasmatota archaeon]